MNHDDIRAELAVYIPEAATYDGKLQIRSPFRYDAHPSTFIDLREHSEYFGAWHDSGAFDPEWQSGNATKLLAFFRGEPYEDTAEYLRDTYDQTGAESYDEPITLKMRWRLGTKTECPPLNVAVLEPYRYRSPYLGGRGISEPVQRMMSVGYDRKARAIVLPIYNANGTIANVKFRKTDAKTFWYYKGGRPIRELLYGIDVVHKRSIRRAAIVEAEIDALTLMTAGIPALATMGAHFTQAKANLIRNSPIEEIVIIRDNDAAGRKWQRNIIETLRHDVTISVATVRGTYKDINEAGPDSARKYVARRRRINGIRILL